MIRSILLDVVDGILPDQIPVNLKTAPREELETYEESGGGRSTKEPQGRRTGSFYLP